MCTLRTQRVRKSCANGRQYKTYPVSHVFGRAAVVPILVRSWHQVPVWLDGRLFAGLVLSSTPDPSRTRITTGWVITLARAAVSMRTGRNLHYTQSWPRPVCATPVVEGRRVTQHLCNVGALRFDLVWGRHRPSTDVRAVLYGYLYSRSSPTATYHPFHPHPVLQ